MQAWFEFSPRFFVFFLFAFSFWGKLLYESRQLLQVRLGVAGSMVDYGWLLQVKRWPSNPGRFICRGLKNYWVMKLWTIELWTRQSPWFFFWANGRDAKSFLMPLDTILVPGNPAAFSWGQCLYRWLVRVGGSWSGADACFPWVHLPHWKWIWFSPFQEILVFSMLLQIRIEDYDFEFLLKKSVVILDLRPPQKICNSLTKSR